MVRKTILRLYRKMTRPGYFAEWDGRFQEIGRKIPTVVLWGTPDHLIPKAYAARTSDRVRYLKRVSHWTPLEAPEAIAEEIQGLANVFSEA